MAQKELPKWVQDPILKRYGYSDYWVEYSVFKSDIPPGVVPPDLKEEYLKKHHKIGHVCFSGLPSAASAAKDSNRLIYHLEIPKAQVKELSPQEKVRWVQLLKANRMLPDYTPENVVEETPEVIKGDSYQRRSSAAEGFYLFDITDALQSIVYFYLTVLRDQRENYGIPKVSLFLAEKGMDFCAAFGFGHRYGSSGSGHAVINISPYGPGYGKPTKYKSNYKPDSLVSLNLLNAMSRFLDNPGAHNKTKLTAGSHWNCYPIIDKINSAKNVVQIDIVDAFNPNVIKAIHAKDDKEFDDHVEAFMEDVNRGTNANYVPGDGERVGKKKAEEPVGDTKPKPAPNVGVVTPVKVAVFAPVKVERAIPKPAQAWAEPKALVPKRRRRKNRRRNEALQFQGW